MSKENARIFWKNWCTFVAATNTTAATCRTLTDGTPDEPTGTTTPPTPTCHPPPPTTVAAAVVVGGTTGVGSGQEGIATGVEAAEEALVGGPGLTRATAGGRVVMAGMEELVVVVAISHHHMTVGVGITIVTPTLSTPPGAFKWLVFSVHQLTLKLNWLKAFAKAKLTNCNYYYYYYYR